MRLLYRKINFLVIYYPHNTITRADTLSLQRADAVDDFHTAGIIVNGGYVVEVRENPGTRLSEDLIRAMASKILSRRLYALSGWRADNKEPVTVRPVEVNDSVVRVIERGVSEPFEGWYEIGQQPPPSFSHDGDIVLDLNQVSNEEAV